MGIAEILFVIFLVLKLGVGGTTVMAWSWWAVCAPLWIVYGSLALLVVIMAIVAALFMRN